MGLKRIIKKLKQVFKIEKAAFIHVPKTGGTYIWQIENKGTPIISNTKYLGHIAVVENKRQFNRIYHPYDAKNAYHTILESKLNDKVVFSTVRNPYDWLVSFYSFLNKKGSYEYEITQKGFEYYIKTLSEREDKWPNKKFIFFQLFSTSGNFLCDWVNRTETLDNDMCDFAKKYNFKYQKKERQRIGKHMNYKTYYTDELIEIVQNTWKRELDLYGYNFDGCNLEQAIIKKDIDPKLKSQMKYNYDRDEFIN